MGNPKLFTLCFGWCSLNEQSGNKTVKSAADARLNGRGKSVDLHEHTLCTK